MCGIAGFIDKQAIAAVATRQLHAMLEQIQHRGPDERGVLNEAQLGCYAGMQRLSIIDLNTGQQPIWNENHTIAVVFNGEIYNYIELRRSLQEAGHTFRTNSDTEVLVHLYEDYGSEMPCRLRGMFAFAIIDLLKRRMLIARDHFGQKPLYYHATADRLAFASEIKSLFELPFVPREQDRDAFLDYVSWFSLPGPQTHFRGIEKLAPGHYLEIDIDRPAHVEARPFWKFGFNAEYSLCDMTAAVDELETTIDEAVRLHLRSDVPVGVMLSGGLDSRVVAEFARIHHPLQLKTFSVTYDGPESEEIAARAAAAALESEHHEVVVQASDLAESIERVAWHLDEPVADPAAFAVLKLCTFAVDHVKVLLAGEGADELFAGYTSRYDGIRRQLCRSNWLRRLSAFMPVAQLDRYSSRLRRACYRSHRSPQAEFIESRIEGFPSGTLARWGLTSRQLARLSIRAQELGRRLVQMQGDALSTAQVLDIDWQLPSSLLMKSDKMSMAASLELRCPFLDVRVADIARRIPPDLRLRCGGMGKLVLRECLRRRVGHLAETPKKGFPIPLDTWLRGPLREIVRESVFAGNSEATAQLDPQLLQEAWTAFLEGEPLGTVFYALWLYEAWRSVFRLNSTPANNEVVRIPHSSSIANGTHNSEESGRSSVSADSRRLAVSEATVRTNYITRELRILAAPDWRAGITYQQDLANALQNERITTRLLSHYRLGFPLFRGARDLEPWDGFHMHWPEAYMSGDAAWKKMRYVLDLALSVGRRPLFLTAHNLYPHNRNTEFLMRSVLRSTVRKASAIFLHSSRARELYIDEFHARPQQCRVIPFGDHSAAVGIPLPRSEARKLLGLPYDEPICLMFGTISYYKGQADVITTWKSVRMPAKLAIVGPAVETNYAKTLQVLCDEDPNIMLKICDWLTPADLRLWLSASDAAVFNYRDILTSGAACLARSFGLPILFPARLDAVDIGEPHPSVMRFQSLVDDLPILLQHAVSRGLRYPEAAQWREQTSWSAVAAATAQVYREIIN